jgi:hypothetical protein
MTVVKRDKGYIKQGKSRETMAGRAVANRVVG